MDAYRAFHFGCIGASHLKKGTVCQDSAAAVETQDYRLAVVCDGHGGEDYFRSDRGSRMAVQAFRECAQKAFAPQPRKWLRRKAVRLKNKADDFAEALNACVTQKEIDEQLLWFARSVVTRWNLLVEEDLAADPFKEEELAAVSDKAKARYEAGESLHKAYGTTLLGAVLTKDFWFGIHIGDGKCVVFDHEGNAAEPILWDENCFLNTTTSICDSAALQEFRVFFSRHLPAAIFVGSDGIDDCFADEEKLYNFYRVVLTSFATQDGEQAQTELMEYLPVLSEKGSGDDMSIGVIAQLDYLHDHKELFTKKDLPQ